MIIVREWQGEIMKEKKNEALEMVDEHDFSDDVVGKSVKTLLEGIACGEDAIKEGRAVIHAQAQRRMARWLR